MWNRLARNPSTASLTPASTKSTKAANMAPDAIVQTTIGTSRMRASVMRFGILKSVPDRGRAPAAPERNTRSLASSITVGGPLREMRFPRRTPARRGVPLGLGRHCLTFCLRTIFLRKPRPTLGKMRTGLTDEMADKGRGLTYAQAGVDIDAGNRMVDLIKPLVRATARAGADAEIGGFGGLF